MPPHLLQDAGGSDAILTVFGFAAPPPAPPTAAATLASAPIVSSTPSPGQGIALDSAGKLPIQIVQRQSGYRLAYTELQSDVNVAATTEATAAVIVTAVAVTLDGSTEICVEFYSYRVEKGSTYTGLYLYDAVGGAAAASIGNFGLTSGVYAPFCLRRFFTPVAGVHAFSIRGAVDAGTGIVRADVGGVGKGLPAYIRVSRA